MTAVTAFADLDSTPAGHFALRVYALVAELLATASEAIGGLERMKSRRNCTLFSSGAKS